MADPVGETYGEMGTREALEVACELLEERASETDTASPEGHRVRLALEMLEMVLKQQGCECHDPAIKAPGHLTDLCDLVIFG